MLVDVSAACNLYLRFYLRLFKGSAKYKQCLPVEVVEVNRPRLEHLVDCLLMLEQPLEAPDHWLCCDISAFVPSGQT